MAKNKKKRTKCKIQISVSYFAHNNSEWFIYVFIYLLSWSLWIPSPLCFVVSLGSTADQRFAREAAKMWAKEKRCWSSQQVLEGEHWHHREPAQRHKKTEWVRKPFLWI